MSKSKDLEVLKELQQSVISETNRIRTNPKSYIPILEECLKNFHGNILTQSNEEAIETEEGPKAYIEAINFLKKQRPISALKYDEEISKCSEILAANLSQGGTDLIEDEKNLEERINKYIDWDVAICENVDFGGNTGVDVILSILVDDGVQLRTHRDNLFNTKVKYFGVSVQKHPEYDFCTVIDYIGEVLGYKDYKKNMEFKKIKKDESDKNKIAENSAEHFERKNSTTRSGRLSPNKTFKEDKEESNIKYNIKTCPNEIYMEDNNLKSIISPDKKNSFYRPFPFKKKQIEYNIRTDFKKQQELEDEQFNEKGKNVFEEDPDVPEGVVLKRKIKTTKKKMYGKTLLCTIKTYYMEDGTEETVTIDEVIFDD